MYTSLIGTKGAMTQTYNKKGTIVPITRVDVQPNIVVHVQVDTNKLKMGYGSVKRNSKPVMGQLTKAGIKKPVQIIKEFTFVPDDSIPEVGTEITPNDVFTPGDVIRIQGITKGKGFAGGVKRWGFSGGPKTHGQTDRHRAPGSIGAGTTPGRVYKGKKMAGRMGGTSVTVENLLVVKVSSNEIWVAGSVPGSKSAILEVSKTGTAKNFDFEVESNTDNNATTEE